MKDLGRGVEFIHILQSGDSRLELYLAIPDSYSAMSLSFDFLSAIRKNLGLLPQSRVIPKLPEPFLVHQDKASCSISFAFSSRIILHSRKLVLVNSREHLLNIVATGISLRIADKMIGNESSQSPVSTKHFLFDMTRSSARVYLLAA